LRHGMGGLHFSLSLGGEWRGGNCRGVRVG
jgi:hypothetical protein